MVQHLKIGDSAPDFALLNSADETVHLQELWGDGPTLLSFIRHFGCLFCREWLVHLEDYQEALTSAGLQTVVVAMGQPKHSARYCGRFAPNLECLVHETAKPYEAYGLTQGSWNEFVNFNVLKAGVYAYSKGYKTGQVIGDPRMMPGTFIVNQQGKIDYAYYSQHVADHPNLESIAEVVASLQVIRET